MPVVSDDGITTGDDTASDADGRDCVDDRNCAEAAGWGKDEADQTKARGDRKSLTPTAFRCSYVLAIRPEHDFLLNHPVF